MLKQWHNLYAPVTTIPPAGGTSGTPSGSMDKDDVIKFLGEDEPEVIPLKEPKTKETKEEKDDDSDEDELPKGDESEDEDDELKDIEEELEEPDAKKLELVTPVRRKEILKKYPQLFKDFPYLETAYYREQQFTAILPTIDDAKEAVDKAGALDRFEADLIAGNTENMLLAAKRSPENFNKLVDNYLVNLHKVDEKAHTHVVGNVIKHTIVAMAREAQNSDNEALRNAAVILNQYVFGSSEFTPATKLAADNPEKDSKAEAQTEREKAFNKRQFDNANNDLEHRVNNAYKSTIEANIDPKESMTDYVRRNASREALENLESLISKDSRFKVIVDKLWERAAEEDYSKPAMDRIKSAFISKARTLLPSVIQKARNEALRGMGKRTEKDTVEESTPRKGPVKEQSRSTNSDRKKSTDIPKGMSSLEFLMQED